LYGDGDYGKTIDISTRCGYDSDCNPANAGGILGTMIGYSNIPDYWKQGIDKVEDMNFKYTTMSLNKVYEVGMDHAVQMVKRNGGEETADGITIKYQKPITKPLEIGFEGIYPTKRASIFKRLNQQNTSIEFATAGNGFVLTGEAVKESGLPDAVLELDLFVDNILMERVKMSTSFQSRKHEIFWNYDLSEGEHTVRLIAVNIPTGYRVNVNEAIHYSSVDPGNTTY
jgi:hypothetical protein